jgi:sugar phosphate isomerase/epimerase
MAVGQGTIWLPPPEYRREHYDRLKQLARAHGIDVGLCACMNNEITSDGSPNPARQQKGHGH